MKLAAIDIGSNAIRLLISEVTIYKDGTLDFTKVNLVRVPLRLGFDVFESGYITERKQQDLLETIKAFRHLLNVYDVRHLKVCATSAMRDASNALSIVKMIQEQTGILIEVISGSEEAQILYETHQAENMDSKNMYLYIDVGGGSTELTFYGKQKQLAKRSFDIGTIRLLKDKYDEEIWDEIKAFLKSQVRTNQQLFAIGSGGNINKIFSLSKRKPGKSLSLELLKGYYKEMASLSIQDRIHRFGFKEDRADVIVPALQIYISVMRWAGIEEIYVPQIGLADGLIRQLYQELSFTSLMGLKPLK